MDKDIDRDMAYGVVKDFANFLNLTEAQLELFLGGISILFRHSYGFVNFRYDLLLDNAGYITTTFNLTQQYETCIYAFLYSNVVNSKVIHKYVCMGPSLKSHDGEYRAFVLKYDEFMDIVAEFENIFDPMREAINKELRIGHYTTECKSYFPPDIGFIPTLKTEMMDMSLDSIFLAMTCMHDLRKLAMGTLENHINPMYHKFVNSAHLLKTFTDIFGSDVESHPFLLVSSSLGASAPDIKLDIKENKSNDPDRGVSIFKPAVVGQKIFPVTIHEASNPDNINFDVWREIQFTGMCSNLALNFISPSFPLINNWFFIQNATKDLFDNAVQHKRYANSQVARAINKQLIDANTYNFVGRDTSLGPLNSKFKNLSQKMMKAVRYSEQDIILTNLCICIMSENVGRTIRDMPQFAKSGKEWQYADFFLNSDIFKKHMFELNYALYCMNTKLKLMHGDLHLNNATINRYIIIPQRMENAQVVFYISGKQYVLPHNMAYATIIDFSRSIYADRNQIIEDSGETFEKTYTKEQNYRILRMLNFYLPDFVENNEAKLFALILGNPDLTFKIITAVDYYRIFGNIGALGEEEFGSNYAISKPAIELSKTAHDYLIDNLKKAIAGEIEVPEDIEWIGEIILDRHFAEFIVQGKLSGVVADYFFYDRNIGVLIDDPYTYPGFMQLDTFIKGNEEGKAFKSRWMSFIKKKQSITRILDSVASLAQSSGPDESSWKFD